MSSNRIRIRLHLRIQCRQVGARRKISSNIIFICSRTGFRSQCVIYSIPRYNSLIPIGNRTRLHNSHIIRIYAIHVRLRNRHVTVSGYIDRGFSIRLDYGMTCYRYIIQRNIGFFHNRILNGTIYSTTGHNTCITIRNRAIRYRIDCIRLCIPVSTLGHRGIRTVHHFDRFFRQVTDDRLTGIRNVIQTNVGFCFHLILQIRNRRILRRITLQNRRKQLV